jgi:hypothetical protein
LRFALNDRGAAPETWAMDLAGASRTPHAASRPLGIAGLLALLVLVLAAAAAAAAPAGAHALRQASAPPAGVPEIPWNDWSYDDEPGPPDHGDSPPAQPQPPAPHPAPPAVGWDVAPVVEEPPPVASSYVDGTVARLRTDGRAAIPRGAPKRVRSLISQYNRIVGKRYKWGGGHALLVDSGYDCSGAVGYGLIKGGLLRTTLVSGSFARWAAAGAGRWVTIYANASHVYTELAGLRLDTSPVGDPSALSGVRWRPPIGQRRGFKRRHPVGL